MALIQAILSLVSRSVGKILTALFDWAVVALFGRVSGRRWMLLSRELDRRRHALTNRTWPAARQAGALVVVALAAWLIAPRLIASYWPRRFRRG